MLGDQEVGERTKMAPTEAERQPSFGREEDTSRVIDLSVRRLPVGQTKGLARRLPAMRRRQRRGKLTDERPWRFKPFPNPD